MARPPSRPMPGSLRCSPMSTVSPMPRAPIIEAMTTMASAIMVVWLMPCMIDGSASGICTPHSICQRVAPKARLASTTSRSTWRMPRSVRRISGGVA